MEALEVAEGEPEGKEPKEEAPEAVEEKETPTDEEKPE